MLAVTSRNVFRIGGTSCELWVVTETIPLPGELALNTVLNLSGTLEWRTFKEFPCQAPT